MLCHLMVINSWILKKLAKKMNDETKIWSSVAKIQKSPNKSSIRFNIIQRIISGEEQLEILRKRSMTWFIAKHSRISKNIQSIFSLTKVDPIFDQTTSNLRKYFNSPKSLILKVLLRACFTSSISAKEFPGRITSSTYTNKVVKTTSLFLIKR